VIIQRCEFRDSGGERCHSLSVPDQTRCRAHMQNKQAPKRHVVSPTRRLQARPPSKPERKKQGSEAGNDRISGAGRKIMETVQGIGGGRGCFAQGVSN
jgi:hypothetical protein